MSKIDYDNPINVVLFFLTFITATVVLIKLLVKFWELF